MGRLLTLGSQALIPFILLVVLLWTATKWAYFYLDLFVAGSLEFLGTFYAVPELSSFERLLVNAGGLIVVVIFMIVLGGALLLRAGNRLYTRFDTELGEIKFLGRLYEWIKKNYKFYTNMKGFMWHTAIIPRWNGVGYEFHHGVILKTSLAAVESGDPDGLIDLYIYRAPNFTSGYPCTMRLCDIIVTTLPPLDHATKLGGDCAVAFEPYIRAWLASRKQDTPNLVAFARSLNPRLRS